MRMFCTDDYLIKSWNRCVSTYSGAKTFLALSRHETFFISIKVDPFLYGNDDLDYALLEDLIVTEIDDIAEESPWLNSSLMDMAADFSSDGVFEKMERQYGLLGLEISLIKNTVEFDFSEHQETMEVVYGMRRDIS